MSAKKRLVADSLFGVQLICTLWFGIGQFSKMLTTTQGVNSSWFVFWEMFLLINLFLAIRAHRNQASRVTVQTIISYALWTIMVTADLAAMIWKETGVWDTNDTVTALLAGAGIVLTFVIAHRYKLGIADPVVKGYLALFFKAVPQLMLAYKILLNGGSGLALSTVITGHITVLTRLGQLLFSIKEAGWDRNRQGSAISELANEASWVVVTIIWLL